MKRINAPLAALAAGLALVPENTPAGTYIFAREGQLNVVTHASGYDGVVDTANVEVCIVPGTANAASMEIPVQNAIDKLNLLVATEGNVRTGSDNDIANNQIDFESVFIHELGHCTGLAHINAASESGLSGNNTNYTKATDGANNTFDIDAGPDNVIGSADDVRGDDENLHWFFVNENNPFALPSAPQAGTYSQDLADLPPGESFPANADRTVSTSIFGIDRTEGIMQQLSFGGETQRALSADEVATYLHAQTGIDRQVGTADDYTMNVTYGGISDSTSCDVNVAFDNNETGFAVCQTGGRGLAGPNVAITRADTFYNTGSNWAYTSQRSPLPGVDNVTVAFGGSTGIVNGGANSLLANDVDQAAGSPGLVMSTRIFFGGEAAANIVLNTNGTFSYTHDGVSGGNDRFVYRVCVSNGSGGETDVCTHQYVNVNVLSSGNNPPIAVGDTATTLRGGELTMLSNGQTSLLNNDSDPDMDNLNVSATPIDAPDHGTLQLSANGTFRYTHDGSLTASDKFTYQVCDDGVPVTCANAEVSISIDVAPAVCIAPNAQIPDNGGPNDGALSTITLTGSGSLADLDVVLLADHTWIGDLGATLSHNGTVVTLLDRPGLPNVNPQSGCSNDNIDATLDDSASNPAEDSCSSTPPAMSGTLSPTGQLADFNGVNIAGAWTLNLFDSVGADIGSLRSWCLDPTEVAVDANAIFANGFE